MNFARLCTPVVAVISLALCGCSSPSGSSGAAAATTPQGGIAADATVLRVGIAPDVPPLAFKAGRQFTGVEPDLARALAADLGRTVVFVEIPWEGLIDALLDNRVDIVMSGMTITPARLMRVNFAGPYLQSGQSILTRRTEADAIQVALFDPKTRVGAQKATTGDFWVKENCSRNRRKVYETAAEGARALVSKSIDAFVCDAPVNWWLASENESAGLTVVGGYLTREYLGWAVRKDDTELLEAANRFIEETKQNGKLQATIRNWIPYQ